MTRTRSSGDPPPDPFDEHRTPTRSLRVRVLGADLEIHSDSSELMDLAAQAFAGLPSHRFGGRAPRLKLRLALAPGPRGKSRDEPPPLLTHAAPGILGASFSGSAFVSVTPRRRSALVVVPRPLLRFAYHLRYELLEFAAYLLAARCQGLVPLHAACVGLGSRGVLISGASGAGKSTFTVAAAAHGLTLISEDSVLVQPRSLRAAGLASYLHLRPQGLHLLPAGLRRTLARAPVIRRRSGVRKLEIDARGAFALARRPLKLRALLFLSAQPPGRDALLRPLSAGAVRARLARAQRYAQRQPGWARFLAGAARLPAFELRRAAPAVQVHAVRALLGGLPR